MRLTELDARFVGSGGEGVWNADGTPAPKRSGIGVVMNCPCGTHGEDNPLYVPFKNPIDGGPMLPGDHGWNRTGETLETLTLTPSIQRLGEGCRWHGFITNGAAVSG